MASVAVEQTGITNEAFQALESCRSLEKDELTIEMVEAGSPLRLRSSDSGCELSSEGSESPTSYRRLDEESSTGYLTCSSVETTVDQSSSIYQEFTQTLNQVRLDNLNILKEPLVLHSMLLESESSVSLKPIIADEPSDDQGTIGHLSEQYDKSKWLDGADGGKEPDIPVMQLTEKASRKSRGRLLPQVLASLALAIAAMIEGYSSGYTSPALASMSHPNSTIPVNLHEVNGLIKPLKIASKINRSIGLMDWQPDASQCTLGWDPWWEPGGTLRSKNNHHGNWSALHSL